MAGYVLYFLSTKKELISRCVVARRSARSIFFFALQTRAKFVRFAFDGRGEIEIGKLQKTPSKVEKRTHAAASNARVFSADDSEETLWTDPFNFFFFVHKQTTANVNE